MRFHFFFRGWAAMGRGEAHRDAVVEGARGAVLEEAAAGRGGVLVCVSTGTEKKAVGRTCGGGDSSMKGKRAVRAMTVGSSCKTRPARDERSFLTAKEPLPTRPR